MKRKHTVLRVSRTYDQNFAREQKAQKSSENKRPECRKKTKNDHTCRICGKNKRTHVEVSIFKFLPVFKMRYKKQMLLVRHFSRLQMQLLVSTVDNKTCIILREEELAFNYCWLNHTAYLIGQCQYLYFHPCMLW